MKVLLSSVVCSPYLGSENFVGWNAMHTLARDHELWVIANGRARSEIERATAEGLVPKNVHFTYVGRFAEWHTNRMRARFQDWGEYRNFSKVILATAQQLHREAKFDLVHHVTYATWRVGSPLWKLGIPFVFGPVGGNEKFPPRLLPMLSPVAAAFELLRMGSNVASKLSPSVRACIRNAAHVFAANAETAELARQLRRNDVGVSLLSQVFYSQERMQAYTDHSHQRTFDGPLQLFAGGNLEGRKGVALAFHALAKAKASGVLFRYFVGQHGPEFAHLKKLAARLGLENEINFGFLPAEEYRKELGTSHIYLLPSLRDAAPATLMDAMLAGCVPVVADCGGPAQIVMEECGYKIPISSRNRFTDALADVIRNLDKNREVLRKKGSAATQRIAANFTEENYRRTVNATYRSVLQSAH